DLDWSEATVDAGRTGRPSRRGGITTAASNGESRVEVATGVAGGGLDSDDDATEAPERRGDEGEVRPAVNDGPRLLAEHWAEERQEPAGH
ncbi:hypothetical protein PF005_g29155, partial [Phytophthora fragariae]